MAVIVAVDPGGSSGTGYAVYDTETRTPLYLYEHPDSTSECIARVWGCFDAFQPDHCVVERFVPRWGQKFELDPVYKIGALEGSGLDFVSPLPTQHMKAVHNSVVNPLFKKAGEKIGKGHKREALRMCLWYAATKLRDPGTLDMLAGQGIKEEK